MPEFTLKHWKAETGTLQRIYIGIDHDYYHPVKMYWEKVNSQDSGLILHGGHNDVRDFPNMYQDSQNPREDLAGDALMKHGIDPDDFTWDELREACE